MRYIIIQRKFSLLRIDFVRCDYVLLLPDFDFATWKGDAENVGPELRGLLE